MTCNIFCIRSMFLLFIRTALLLAFAVYLAAGVRAQNAAQPLPTPTLPPEISPTPLPAPRTLAPGAVASPTPPQSAGNVQPEDVPGVPQIAPQYKYEDRNLPDLGRVGVDLLQQRPLTLREALEFALNNNKDIEVARKNTQISEFDLRAAQGVYEPRFSLQSFYERSVVPSASTIIGGADGKLTQSSLAGNATFSVPESKFGGVFSAQFDNSRTTSTSPVNTLNPQFPTTFTVQYAQPLFRGRSFDQNRRQIEIAKKNLSLNDAQFRQRTIEVITDVQRAYWDLTFALKNLQVQRDAVRDAKDQLEHNQRLVNEGLLAPIDVVASETQVANFEQAVYDALNNVTLAENNLKNLIAQNRNDSLWTVSVIPTDTVEVEAPAIDLTGAVTEALANRPELEQNTVAQEINSIDQRYFREQTKPRIDLVANYTLSGLAGTEVIQEDGGIFGSNRALIERINLLSARQDPTLPRIEEQPRIPLPENLRGGYFNSLTNLFANRYPTYRVGVTIDLPFASRTAKAQLGRSLVEGQRVQTQREQLEQAIQVDVRNALQLLRTSQARLRAAAIARENNEKQYESEQRKLDAGQSTVFLVLERQTALTNARGAEIRAQTELNKAIADLQRATGNSLRANNIVARMK